MRRGRGGWCRHRSIGARRVAVVGVGGLEGRRRGGGCRDGPAEGPETRGEAGGPLPVLGEPEQLGLGHLVEELVGEGLGVGGRRGDEVFVRQGEGAERAVAVAAVGARVAREV
jgi:hypothetical protein